MTDHRRRLVDLSVLGLSALVLGAAVLVVADVDRSRPRAPVMNVVADAAPAQPAAVAQVSGAPVAGLVAAPAAAPVAARKIVYVRRSRAS